MKSRVFSLILLPAILAVVFSCAGPRGLIQKLSLTPEVKPRLIVLQASNYRFSPKVIEIGLGEEVDLYIESAQGVHGFKCPALEVDELIRPDQPVTIRIVAKKIGKVPFYCSHFCGWGHLLMRGKIVVTDKRI